MAIRRCPPCPGLFAAGEAAAGLHGANRLGGNSLSDLRGLRAARRPVCRGIRQDITAPRPSTKTASGHGQGRARALRSRRLAARIHIRFNTICRKPCRTWSASSAPRMKCNRRWTGSRNCATRAAQGGDRRQSPVQQRLAHGDRSRNLLIVSEAITRAALLRKESRGAQFREDFPNKDAEWGKYNIVVKRGAGWRNAGGEARSHADAR